MRRGSRVKVGVGCRLRVRGGVGLVVAVETYKRTRLYLLEVLGTEVVGMLGLDLVDLLEELLGVRHACRAIAELEGLGSAHLRGGCGPDAMVSSLPAITSSGLSGRPSFTMQAIADCKLLSIPCSATV